jgi:hypothetical protein
MKLSRIIAFSALLIFPGVAVSENIIRVNAPVKFSNKTHNNNNGSYAKLYHISFAGRISGELGINYVHSSKTIEFIYSSTISRDMVLNISGETFILGPSNGTYNIIVPYDKDATNKKLTAELGGRVAALCDNLDCSSSQFEISL